MGTAFGYDPGHFTGADWLLGRFLVSWLDPWADCGRAVAIDSTVLRALGGVWYKKDRVAGIVPHSSIDTDAHWTKSGWHGWVDGWKLHLVCTAAAIWVPLAAELTPANAADNEIVLELVPELPPNVRFLLGDQYYRDSDLDQLCAQNNCLVIAPQGRPYPHTDDGVEVRHILHKLRSITIENFNEQFKDIFETHGQVPTKGLVATRRFALGAVFLYQLAFLYRFSTVSASLLVSRLLYGLPDIYDHPSAKQAAIIKRAKRCGSAMWLLCR